MILFVVAHKKEAEAFIEYFALKSVPFIFEGFYEGQNIKLIISGEGLKNASERTLIALTKFPEITEVINLGVAGSVTSKIKVGEIHFVRTVYAHNGLAPEFKSFTSDIKSTYDCMSLSKRVLHSNEKIEYAKFADIIDREAWSIASAAHIFKKPFYAMKYISDDLDSKDFCQLVIDEAHIISAKILDFYLKNKSHQNDISNQETFYDHLLNDKRFHFTLTQKRQLQSIVLALQSIEYNLDAFSHGPLFSDISTKEITPKERSKQIIQTLLLELNPFHKTVSNKIDKLLHPFQKKIHFKYDMTLERNEIEGNFKFSTETELNEIINTLRNFPIKSIHEIFAGKFDV